MAAPQILAPDAAAIARAAGVIARGGLVGLPTETVYGLAADATSGEAVAQIFAAKGRPHFNPLIVHGPDADSVLGLGHADSRARALGAMFWPGPLTLVLHRAQACPVDLLCSAGGPTLGLRVPAHPVARALLEHCGRPLAAPSANRSGRVSPTTAAHVAAEFPEVDLPILDGGPCRVGVESTVVDLTSDPPRLLRPGGIPAEDLAAVLGRMPARHDPADPDAGPDRSAIRASPGMLPSHYAPSRPVRLIAWGDRPVAQGPGEALLAFGPAPHGGFAEIAQLSGRGDPVEAAARLFVLLRTLDRPEVATIVAMLPPEVGLGTAIADRLRRAAQR